VVMIGELEVDSVATPTSTVVGKRGCNTKTQSSSKPKKNSTKHAIK